MKAELRPKLVKFIKTLDSDEKDELLLILKEAKESFSGIAGTGKVKSICPPDIDANGSYGNAVHILEGD